MQTSIPAPPTGHARWTLVVLCLILAHCACAAEKWDITQARGQTREIDFTTEEGTWMSLDVSPDGQWIIFDLLAHVYRVPMAGGDAECLTQDSGVALNFHPRYSPDGKYIAFVSDRMGYCNLWVMDADGRNPRLIASDPEVRVSQPAWSADGRAIIVQRNFNGNYWTSLGLWRYPLDGSPPEKLADGETGHGSPSRDGKKIYYHALTGVRDLKNIDLLAGGWQINVHDTTTKQPSPVTVGPNGAIAPEVSPDDRWLAFARRIPDGTISFKGHRYGPRTALWLRDLLTGEEKVLLDPIECDIAETGGDLLQQNRLIPGYAWTRDGRAIVIAQGGKIRRVEVATGAVATVPFKARVQRTISEMAWQPGRLDEGPVGAKFLRWVSLSPDGQRLVFQAFGRLWVAGSQGENPTRLTPADFEPLEFTPSWSPDGQWVAFVTWDEEQRGMVWKVPAGGGQPLRLTRQAGEYLYPAWSDDGRTLVLVEGGGATVRGLGWSNNTHYHIASLSAEQAGDTFRLAQINRVGRSRELQAPYFGPGGRIYFPENRNSRASSTEFAYKYGPETRLVSVAPDGGDRQVHLTVPFAGAIRLSPDGRRALIEKGSSIYAVMDVHKVDPQASLALGGAEAPMISRQGGHHPQWVSADKVAYSTGRRLFLHDLASGAIKATSISVSEPRRMPSGTLALVGARIITLEDRKVIENGVILINGNRLAYVGPAREVQADRTIDVRGKTIIPGFVDMHNSFQARHDVITPRMNAQAATDFAFGVTTVYSPSMWSQTDFPLAELVETGVIVGPRLFSGADKLRWDAGPFYVDVPDYASTEREIAMRAEWGATAIKQYLREADRAQRQWVAEASRQVGVKVTAHLVKGFLEYGLSLAMDGYTGVQHVPVQVPVYSDVSRFFGAARFTHNVTFGMAGGIVNEDYYLSKEELWKNQKLRRFASWNDVVPAMRRRTIRPDSDYQLGLHAQAMADIITHGGLAAIGSHGQHPGLSPHIEIWIFAAAMDPMSALESASLHGARFLGLEEDLGSLAAGKVADLLILDENPLENIRHTMAIRHVMKGGVLYDGETLDEIWPTARPFPGSRRNEAIPQLRLDDRPVASSVRSNR